MLNMGLELLFKNENTNKRFGEVLYSFFIIDASGYNVVSDGFTQGGGNVSLGNMDISGSNSYYNV